MNKYQQSVFDFIFDHLDHFQAMNSGTKNGSNSVDDRAASALYRLWKDTGSRLYGKTYRKPAALSQDDVSLMKKEGLVHDIGDRMTFTDKGSQIIKIMILGENSALNPDGTEITYAAAIVKTKGKSLKVAQKTVENDWWKLAMRSED